MTKTFARITLACAAAAACNTPSPPPPSPVAAPSGAATVPAASASSAASTASASSASSVATGVSPAGSRPAGGKPGACTSDGDCRTWSSYCSEAPCACRVLSKDEGDPRCMGPSNVRCFADPCMNKSARCEAGACVLTAATK